RPGPRSRGKGNSTRRGPGLPGLRLVGRGPGMTTAEQRRPSPFRRLAIWLARHPRTRLALLLAAPVAWLGVAYLGSLGVLFLNSIWQRDEFTGLVRHDFSLDNFSEILTNSLYRNVILRTVGMAT